MCSFQWCIVFSEKPPLSAPKLSGNSCNGNCETPCINCRAHVLPLPAAALLWSCSARANAAKRCRAARGSNCGRDCTGCKLHAPPARVKCLPSVLRGGPADWLAGAAAERRCCWGACEPEEEDVVRLVRHPGENGLSVSRAVGARDVLSSARHPGPGG